ncbi:MAG TPA: nitrous oxide reductase accessory protein NosL [Ginsengibacter sp.]|nr:nitrous oxide reductase accessory protein NosL [Ginsengibacter sp.]HRP17050.1 nitrous oxide reductase accessory protein NosL [Ginsengibacter sp.]HRP44082.1 nitrous oxide reductase accessory protein NosL [Ginsengibacter sp.]
MKKIISVMVVAVIVLVGCSSGPQPIQLGKDSCDFCKMSIADKNFGAEIITDKGKVYKFDDTHCLVEFRKTKIDSNKIKEVYLVNFGDPHNFIKASEAILLRSEDLHSPMGGNVAAFDNQDYFNATQQKVHGDKITLQDLYSME